MIKVAIIDDGVNNNVLLDIVKKPETYKVFGPLVLKCKSEKIITHGTICASIIGENITNVNIISIKVKKHDRNGNIKDLITAIKYCNKKNIKVLNISLGSTFKSDKKLLESIIKESNSIIISAMSNSGEETYPANLKHVIAVKNQKNKEKGISISKNGFNVLVEMNCVSCINTKIGLVKFKPCNSFATASLTHHIICSIHNDGDLEKLLKEYI